MSRSSAGPHLWFDKARQRWTVVDREHRERTGFAKAQIAGAQEALAAYIVGLHAIKAEDDPPISDVLSAYLTEHLDTIPSGTNTSYHLTALEAWWGDKRASDVTPDNCQLYAKTKNAPGARADLKVLRAALGHWHKFHTPLKRSPGIVLPKASAPRERYLTRQEFTKLLWAARRVPHLRRFMLISWYTGSRSLNVFRLRWKMIHFDSGVLRRLQDGERTSHKGAPPVRGHYKLIGHLARWKRIDGDRYETVLHYRGRPVTKLRRSFASAVEAAGLGPGVTPHVFRHSRATHLMLAGVQPYEAANSLGMSLEVLLRVYGHHHPDFQTGASAVR
jgi:integrase